MKKLIRDIFSAITVKERRKFRLFIFLNTVINLADVFSVVCLLFVVKFYTQSSPVYTSNALLLKVLPGKDSVLPVLLLIAMFAIKNIAGHFVYRAQVRFVSGVSTRKSEQNLSEYLEGPYSNYAGVDSAVFVNKIIYQPIEFAQYVLQGCQQIITELLLIAFSIIALLIYNARLFTIVSLTMLPAIGILAFLTKKRLDKIKTKIKTVAEQSLQYLSEALSGYVESNIYNKNSFFINRHKQSRKELAGYISNMQTTQDLPARFFEVFAILGLFALIVAIKYTAAKSNADVVMLGAFMAAAYKIIPGISKIINLSGLVRTYRYTINGEITDRHPVRQTESEVIEKIASIEFNNIHFSYNDISVLNGFNCSLYAGSFIGVSGDSGSGKTTFMQLLLGFCTENSGTILFNRKATDYRTRIASWSRIAYVKQEPFILHDSILNNIVLFENEYKKDHLAQVLEVTGLKEIIDQFPEGINKQITEAGRNISGGQRKRIAIARALYKDADVLLLDEPFSELDEPSELKMLQYLKQLAQAGKMVILISHNRSSFQLCDTIINF